MKKRSPMIFVVTVCALLAGFSVNAQTIMPFGDSVTSEGNAPESSYRYWLWQYLQNAGFTGVSFVGSQYGVSDGAPANSDFDQHYEGGPGWETSTAVDDLGTATSFAPDVVLLDFGANDAGDTGADLNQAITNLVTVMEGFAAANGNVTILLAVPTRWVVDTGNPIDNQQVKQRMGKLPGIVNKAAAIAKREGIRVVTVNLFGGFNPRTDTVDGVHPNVQGEQKIAKKFYAALRKVL